MNKLWATVLVIGICLLLSGSVILIQELGKEEIEIVENIPAYNPPEIQKSPPIIEPEPEPIIEPEPEPILESIIIEPEPEPIPEPEPEPILKPTVIEVVIPPNIGSDTISFILKENGIINNAEDFNNYVKQQGKSRVLQKGTFNFTPDMTYKEILDIMTF